MCNFANNRGVMQIGWYLDIWKKALFSKFVCRQLKKNIKLRHFKVCVILLYLNNHSTSQQIMQTHIIGKVNQYWLQAVSLDISRNIYITKRKERSCFFFLSRMTRIVLCWVIKNKNMKYLQWISYYKRFV